MFDLAQAIAEWRRQMQAAGIKSQETLEELEGHLREEIRRQAAGGTPAEEAFRLAVASIGNAVVLRAEFSKVETGQWNRPLAYLAWGMFTVSFFLPSYSDGAGWRCAGLSANALFEWLFRKNEIWSDCHLALLTLADVVMVTSPLLLRLFAPAGQLWNRIMAIGSVILVWSFLIRLACGDWQDLRFGALVWGMSFVILGLAMFKGRSRRAVEKFA